MRRILCPTDFSECSDAARAMAVELARATGAELRLLHVQELFAYTPPELEIAFTDPKYFRELTGALETSRRASRCFRGRVLWRLRSIAGAP